LRYRDSTDTRGAHVYPLLYLTSFPQMARGYNVRPDRYLWPTTGMSWLMQEEFAIGANLICETANLDDTIPLQLALSVGNNVNCS